VRSVFGCHRDGEEGGRTREHGRAGSDRYSGASASVVELGGLRSLCRAWLARFLQSNCVRWGCCVERSSAKRLSEEIEREIVTGSKRASARRAARGETHATRANQRKDSRSRLHDTQGNTHYGQILDINRAGLPGERRLYESAGGLDSSRTALILISNAHGQISMTYNVRIRVHSCGYLTSLYRVLYRRQRWQIIRAYSSSGDSRDARRVDPRRGDTVCLLAYGRNLAWRWWWTMRDN
jgi:hypothetical protein